METAIGIAWVHLDRAGIPCVLLKGPSIARWLYEDEIRYSNDIDLLVPPARFRDAQFALAELGYDVPLADAALCEVGPYCTFLLHPNGTRLDLHHRLVGTPTEPPERCWDVLSMHTTPFPLVTGVEIRALAVPARTLHLALHVAQNGPRGAKSMADLERGVAQIDIEDWQAAASLAETAGAMQAFAEGLRLCDKGVALAEELGLPQVPRNVELELRITSAPFESLFFIRLADTHGLHGKAALVGRKLWPTADFLRMHYDVARRGSLGLLLAHLLRPLTLLRRGGPAVIAWVRARSRVRRAESQSEPTPSSAPDVAVHVEHDP